jgi:hypothetical protein
MEIGVGAAKQIFNQDEIRFTQRSSPAAGGVKKQEEGKEKPSGRKPPGFSFWSTVLSPPPCASFV